MSGLVCSRRQYGFSKAQPLREAGSDCANVVSASLEKRRIALIRVQQVSPARLHDAPPVSLQSLPLLSAGVQWDK